MKNIIIIILIAASLFLGQIATAKSENTRLAAEVAVIRTKADDQEKVIAQLETNVFSGKEALTAKSAELDKAMAELARAQANYLLAQAEVQKQAARITELETQRTGLAQKMEDLQGSIASLETQIAETKKKLAASEGDRQELLAQLKRLESEKSDLVAQFNNISALRTQLAKLKEEAAIAQRLAWIRGGLYANQEKKGAQRLLVDGSEKKDKPDNRLNVEVEQNGGARVVTPGTAPVN